MKLRFIVDKNYFLSIQTEKNSNKIIMIPSILRNAYIRLITVTLLLCENTKY